MKNRKIKPHKFIGQRRCGFTLVEVLVSLFLLFIVISAASALVSKALSSTQTTRSKFIASYLAQEGIEIAVNIRDANWVNQVSWDNGLAARPEGLDYEADYQSPSLSSYQGRYLRVDSNGFYNYTNGDQSIFIRKITVQKIDDLDGTYHLRVISQVNWTQKGQNYTFSAIEDLYNWYGSS